MLNNEKNLDNDIVKSTVQRINEIHRSYLENKGSISESINNIDKIKTLYINHIESIIKSLKHKYYLKRINESVERYKNYIQNGGPKVDISFDEFMFLVYKIKKVPINKKIIKHNPHYCYKILEQIAIYYYSIIEMIEKYFYEKERHYLSKSAEIRLELQNVWDDFCEKEVKELAIRDTNIICDGIMKMVEVKSGKVEKGK